VSGQADTCFELFTKSEVWNIVWLCYIALYLGMYLLRLRAWQRADVKWRLTGQGKHRAEQARKNYDDTQIRTLSRVFWWVVAFQRRVRSARGVWWGSR